jgi:hypothetical protein
VRKVDDELGSRRAKQLAEFQQLIEDSSIEYARQLAGGQVRITASDFVGLIKATLLLQGAPAARIELISASNEWVGLRSRILEALADHPQARLALAEALDPARLLRAAGMQPDPFQEAICRTAKDTLVLVCRQGGKSTAAGCAAAHRALYKPNTTIVIISPTQHQAVEVRRKAEQFLRVAIQGLEPTSSTETRIELANGSRVIALPADPDTIRGYTAHLLLIDEAARVTNELFAAAQPMLAATGGRTIALTTPAGPRGWFHEAWMGGSDEWERIHVRAEECSRISPAQLAKQRSLMTAAVYATEYDCEFNDPIGAVFHSSHVYAALDTTLNPLFTGGW